MTTSHFVMQGKGGVGKSLVSSILIQYLLKRGKHASGCDTDPVNASLSRNEYLDVKLIDIMHGNDIDPKRFDEVIQHIDGSPADSHVVVDIGASCFIALCAYLKQCHAFDVLRSHGHTVCIHVVIAGGVNLVETLNNYSALAHNFDAPIVVWLNPFFGDIKIENEGFENLKVYRDTAASVFGIVEMPHLSAMFAPDFVDMQAKHLTFEEGASRRHFDLMPSNRLRMIWERYQEAIDRIGLV